MLKTFICSSIRRHSLGKSDLGKVVFKWKATKPHKERFFFVERKFKESRYLQSDIIGATKKWKSCLF
jgi:hypothetical protein